MPNAEGRELDTSCVVVAICGTDTLVACVARLKALQPPPGEIIICAAETFEIPRELEASPDLKLVRAREDSPVALAAAGIAASKGKLVFLTEDHCLPVTGWVAELSSALGDRSCAAAGGPIDSGPAGSSFDWAFFLVDFFRYVTPVTEGPVHSLSVCNVAYRKETLDDIRSEWAPGFHETRVHELLKSKGSLAMVPGAALTSNRSVHMRDGIRERYAFGRLFAAGRFRSGDAIRRSAFAAGTIVLPLLLYARIARRCLADAGLTSRFAKAMPHIVLLLLAWSLGELVGYVTGNPPASSPAARNRSPLTEGQPLRA